MAQINKRNVTIGEIVVDLSEMLSILRPLFGKEGILPERAMTELLRLPLSKLFSNLADEMPPMQESEIENLRSIQDEVRIVMH